MASRRSWGKIRRLASGRLQASYVGPDLVRHVAPQTFQDKDAASVWLREERRLVENHLVDRVPWVSPAERDRQQKTAAAARSTTFRDFAEDYLGRRSLRASTQLDYRKLLDRYIYPKLGDLPIADITPAVIQEWFARLGPHKRSNAKAYVLTRAIFTEAMSPAFGLVSANPCVDSKAGIVRKPQRFDPPTLAEFETIVAEMPDHLKLFVLLAGWLGLRYGEIAALQRNDFDLVSEVVRVRRGVVWAPGEALVGSPKTESGVRAVTIPPHIVPAVQHHLDTHVGPERTALAFPGPKTGEPLRASVVYRWFYRARLIAGREDLRLHDLRHFAATMAAQAGATVPELMARLGHATPDASMIYLHKTQLRDAEIAKRLTALARPEPPAKKSATKKQTKKNAGDGSASE